MHILQLLLFIEGLYYRHSPVNRTGSPQGFFAKSNLTEVECIYKHAHFTIVKHDI